MAKKKRPKDKPKKTVAAIGAPRENYIDGITLGGVHFRERCVNVASCAKARWPSAGPRWRRP